MNLKISLCQILLIGNYLTCMLLCLKLQGDNIKLSQNSNFYINQHSNGLVFIGSRDGLNLYNGQETKVYKPSSHNILGRISQSQFFEDDSSNVWFANYTGVNVYINEKDDFQNFQFSSPDSDSLIVSDYRVVHLEN
ncbi:MAG: hypothetical protein AAGA77_25700, partial [Bacteroidota bacterium]